MEDQDEDAFEAAQKVCEEAVGRDLTATAAED
jgi:hypothetical protein